MSVLLLFMQYLIERWISLILGVVTFFFLSVSILDCVNRNPVHRLCSGCRPNISGLGSQRQKNHKFKASLGHKARPVHKKERKKSYSSGFFKSTPPPTFFWGQGLTM